MKQSKIHKINTKVARSLSVRPSSSPVPDDTECVLSLLDVSGEGAGNCVRLPTITKLDGTHKAHMPTAVPLLKLSVYKPSFMRSQTVRVVVVQVVVVYILFMHSCVVYEQYIRYSVHTAIISTCTISGYI